jgi:AcrR family transcriptional regulator
MATVAGTTRKSTSRIEHRERMVEDILAAAQEIVLNSGASALSMRTLGRKVGVTAATLYGYFDSKEAVLEALLHRHMTGMTAAMLEASAGLPPGAARILGFALGYRRFAQTTPAFFQMFVSKSKNLPWDESGRLVDEGHSLSQLYMEVEAAMARDEMLPAETGQSCLTLWSIAHGYAALEASGCFAAGDMSEEEHLTAFMQYLRVATLGVFTPLGRERMAEYFPGFRSSVGGRIDG